MGSAASTRRPQRFAIIAAIAVVMLVVADGVVRTRASAIPLPQKWLSPDLAQKESQIRELERDRGASVVFLGSSAIDASVDPSVMRASAGDRPKYNAGLRGGTIRMVATWARYVALPRLRPDVVVIGVVSRELNEDDPTSVARERDFFAAPAVRYLLGKENLVERAERHLEDTSALFRYRTIIRQPRFFRSFLGLAKPSTLTDSVFGDYIAPDGQFRLFLKRPYGTAAFMAEESNRYSVGDVQRETLRKLLAYLQKTVNHLVVVNMPVTDDYVAALTWKRSAYLDFTQTLRQDAGRVGATYIDTGIWPSAFFADPIHVNARGSRRFTSLIDRTLEGFERSPQV